MTDLQPPHGTCPQCGSSEVSRRHSWHKSTIAAPQARPASPQPGTEELAGDYLLSHPDYETWENVAAPGIGGIRFTWPQVVKLMNEWRSRTGSSLNWERDCPKCGDCPKPCLCSCHVGTANDPRKAAPPSSPGAPQTDDLQKFAHEQDLLLDIVEAWGEPESYDIPVKRIELIRRKLDAYNTWLASSPGADTEQKNG